MSKKYKESMVMRIMKSNIEVANDIVNEVRKVIIGKDMVIVKVLTTIFAGGHILLEDIPGVGKTTLAVAFANAMSLDYNRLQFTPDVLPSDVTGFSVYNAKTGEFEYKEGAVMCNLFLADEINRTSTKTQSALLEVMEEGFVTVDGVRRQMKSPFIVIATQNPVGSAGTQKLPDSQLDRFMTKLSIGYPSEQDEYNIFKGNGKNSTMSSVEPVASAQDIERIKKDIHNIYIEESVLKYIVGLVNQTRQDEYIELGVSPRGGIALVSMAKANAFMHGRDYVIPNDVKEIFLNVATHRIVLNKKAKVAKLSEQGILTRIITDYPVPNL